MQPETLFSDTPDFRRGIFLMKTDIPVDDSVLRCLRADNRSEAQNRSRSLAVAVQECMGEQVTEITPDSTQGTFHLIHRLTLQSGRKLVARSSVARLFQCDEGLLIEPFAQQELEKVGLPAVKVHAVDVSKQYVPFEFMLADAARGRCLAQLGDEVMEEPRRLAAIGEAMAHWHRIPIAGAGLLDVQWLVRHAAIPRGVHHGWYNYLMVNLDKHLHACGENHLIDDMTKAQIRDWFVQHKSLFAMRPLCLLHGDAGNHNLYMEGDRISAVLDWEDALAGDPLYDIAMWATFHPARRWPHFLEGYGIRNARAPEFTLPFALYFLRITLAKIIHRARFGYVDVEGRPKAKDRLLQALELVREGL